MDFAFRPDVLTSGTRYQGEPADFWELFTATAERQRLVDGVSTRLFQLESAYDQANDQLEKAGVGRLFNPMRQNVWTLDPEERDKFQKWLNRESANHAWTPSSETTAEYFAPRWEADFEELKAKHPDKAALLAAIKSPLLTVGETMRKADERSGIAQASRNEAYSWLNPYRVLEGTTAVLGGSIWGARYSPPDLIANLVGASGRAGYSLLRNAMRNAAANAGVQAVLEPGIQSQRHAAGLESGFGMALEDIALAGAAGGALDVAVRAPVRAYRRATGVEGLGGVFRDAPSPETPLPVTPDAPPAPVRPAIEIPPDLEARLKAGDASVIPDIDRIINAVPELAEDPVVRGAVAEVVKESIAPLKIPGVDDADGLRTFFDQVRADIDPAEPRPRMPDETPETSRFDLDRANRLLIERDADIARLMDAVRPRLEQLSPGVTDRIQTLVDAGLSDLLPLVETALRSTEPETAAETFARDVLSLANTIPPERLAALSDLASGGGNPVALASHLRSFPDLVDRGLPQTEAIRMARSLARLADDAFARVERGEADPRIAQVVADYVEDTNQHGSVLDNLAKANITDPELARRTLNDLVTPPRQPDGVPLEGANPIDDPNGKQAQAQSERLAANPDVAAEMARAAETLDARKAQAEQARVAADAEAAILQRAEDIRQIARDMGMVPQDVPVKVFTGMADLDPATRAHVERANLDAFADALRVFQRAATDDQRLAARAQMELAKANRAVEGFHQDGVVWIAATALDPEGRIAHEVVHALVEAGRLTRAEVKLLAERARSLGIMTPEREALYRATYERRGVTQARLGEMLDEEAAAHFVEAYKRLPQTPEAAPETVKAQGIVARLMDLFRQVRDRLLSRETAAISPDTAAKSPADPVRVLLDQLIAGEISKRERMHAVMAAEDLTAVAVREPMGRSVDDVPIDPITGDRITGARGRVRGFDGPMYALADRDTGRSMRADMDALGYRSKALEAAKGLKQARGTPEQMLAQLKSAGVKDAEIEATNLKSLLDGKPSITRDEIVSYLTEHRVGLREAAYQGSGMPPISLGEVAVENDGGGVIALRMWNNDGRTIGTVFVNAADGRIRSVAASNALNRYAGRPLSDLLGDDLSQRALAVNGSGGFDAHGIIVESDAGTGAAGPAKWSSHSLDPANPSYRETVIHLPSQGRIPFDEWRQFKRSFGEDIPDNAQGRAAYDAYMKEHGFRSDADFNSGHFNEPNIVGHMMTSMVKHEGKATYLIDQIQSDWGQKLRDGGVRDEAKIAELKQFIADDEARLKQLTDERNRFVDEHADDRTAVIKESVEPGDGDKPLTQRKVFSQQYVLELMSTMAPTPEVRAQAGLLQEQLARLGDNIRLRKAELRTAEASPAGHPLVNTTDQWTNTVLRRAIRQAAEADAEYIAIPHGDTVLSYNPGDEGGMRGFYGSRTTEGIVPKNLRKLLEKIDKTAAKPVKVEKLETTQGLEGYQNATTRRDNSFDFDQTGFTLFPLTQAVKRSVVNEGQMMFAFAGERARTADLDALAKAKEMEAAKADRKDIWSQTGWFKGPDGKWRFEIDDSGASVRSADEPKLSDGSIWRVGDVLNHDQFARAYPASNRHAVITRGDIPGGGLYASGIIGMGVLRGEPQYKSVLLHELQHVVQDAEGFARGANVKAEAAKLPVPDHPIINQMKQEFLRRVFDEPGYRGSTEALSEWDRILKLESQANNTIAEELYHRSAGEVEARTVQKRMNLTPAERRARPPWEDYDVPESQQIVRFDHVRGKLPPEPDQGPMYAIAGPPQREDQIATLARAFQQATQAAQAAAPGVSIERTPDGIVARVTRGPKTYDVTRDPDGRVLNLEVSNDLAAQAQAAYANLLQAVTARLPPEQMQAYGDLAGQTSQGAARSYDVARDAEGRVTGVTMNPGALDITTLSQRAAEAMAQAQPLAETLAGIRRSVETTLGPEQTAQLIDAVLQPLPEPARSTLRQLIDTVTLPEPEPAPRAANDNRDLGPVSPVERDLHDMGRINAIMELIGACGG